jgi:hypothetical protein
VTLTIRPSRRRFAARLNSGVGGTFDRSSIHFPVKDQTSQIYRAIVWVGEEPGVREEVIARNVEEAAATLKEKYGHEVVFSLWNEEDASSAR